MSFVDDIRETIEGVLEQIDENGQWVETNGPLIIDALAEAYLRLHPLDGWYVNPIADRAKAELRKAVENLRAVYRLIKWEIQFMGSPDNLRAAADAIDMKAVEPARTLADELVLGKIPSALPSNYTDGEASEGYVAAIDGRDAAVRDVDTYASPVATALRDLADAIEEYYKTLRDLAIDFAGLVVSIVLIIVGWETIVIGVIGIIGAVVSLVKMGFDIADFVGGTQGGTDAAREAFEAEVPAWPAVLS